MSSISISWLRRGDTLTAGGLARLARSLRSLNGGPSPRAAPRSFHLSLYPEHFLRRVDGVHERIALLDRVVQVEARARRGGDAESRHEQLVAVVSGAHAHALPVEEGGDVVR